MDNKQPPGVPKHGFVNRNLPYIVMIPGLILVHLGWVKLQDTAAAKKGFTPEQIEDGKKQPILKIFDAVLKRIELMFSSSKSD